jgi:hypothetical protein
MDAEVWKVVIDDPQYSVSSKGRVKNRVTDKLLRVTPTANGYPTVALHGVSVLLHRLVYINFIDENLPDRQHVRHYNGDLMDCSVENLYSPGRKHYEPTGNPPGRPKKRVRVVETGIVYPSQIECAAALGVRTSFINNVLRGRSRTVKGMHLEYAD